MKISEGKAGKEAMMSYAVSREDIRSLGPYNRKTLFNSFFQNGSPFSPVKISYREIDFKTHRVVSYYTFLRSFNHVLGTVDGGEFFPSSLNKMVDISDGSSIDDCILSSASEFLLSQLREPGNLPSVAEIISKTAIITLGCTTFDKNQLTIVTNIIVDEGYLEEFQRLSLPLKRDWHTIQESCDLSRCSWLRDFLTGENKEEENVE